MTPNRITLTLPHSKIPVVLFSLQDMGRKKAGADKLKENSSHEDDASKREKLLQEEVQEKVSELRTAILQDVDRFVDKLSVRRFHLEPETDLNSNTQTHLSNGSSTNGLKGRHFISRNSYLTDLLRINHMSAIYNVFLALLLVLFINTAVHNILETGTLKVGFDLVYQNFQKFPTAFLIWCQMFLSTFVVYYGLVFWNHVRNQLITNKKGPKYFDYGMIAAFFVYFVVHMLIPCAQIHWANLSISMKVAVLMEQIRLIMKMYAYVRTIVSRVLQKTATNDQYLIPSVEKFLYYQFAPTFIYKDEYPRTHTIRWTFALARFAEMGGIILLAAFLFERYIIPRIENFGTPDVPPSEILSIILDTAVPGLIMMVISFYGLLHSWLNGVAEILRFGDRMFYKDWWNSSDLPEYLKTWNGVVYDWLYLFVYVDAGGKWFKNKSSRKLLVIFTSAVFHDYIITFAAGYFIPYFIIVYGLTAPLLTQLHCSSQRLGNIFLWFSLALGWGILISVYVAEHYIRINCPIVEKSPVVDFFTLRILTCPYSR